MQKTALRFLMLLMFVISNVFAYAGDASPRKGVIRVKLQPEVAAQVGNAPRMQTAGVFSTGVTTLDASTKAIKAHSIRRVFPYAPKYEAQRAKYGLDRWYEISFDESVPTAQALSVLKATAGVQNAHGIVPMELKENARFRKVTALPKSTSTAMPFNDPRLSSQWHYQNDGSLPQSVAGADINLFEAWKTCTGLSDVIVAIIDGGIDLKHEDLAVNIAVNEVELNGQAGVDDDGNGYVDDIYGWNFCTNTPEIYPHDHGTHVAGTVAAVNNNGLGVCGVAGGNGTVGSGVKMISVQVFDTRSGTNDADFAAALVYAAERGASIAQCSWGWGAADYVEQSVLDAIDYFTESAGGENMNGGLCIFASGNNGETGNWYPGCYEPVIAVGAMNNDLTPSTYSNYGEWVDITAPGGQMDYGSVHGILSTLPDNSYGYSEGTSMATPHVSGIAALVLSAHGNATIPNTTIRQQIETSVNDFYAVNPAVKGLFGSGYIDAAKALVMDVNGSAPSAVSEINAYPGQDNIVLGWHIPASSDNNVNNHILYYSKEAFDANSDLSALSKKTIDTKFLSSGDSTTYELTGLEPLTTYYLALKAVNRWGNASDLSPVVVATTNAGPKMTVDKTSLSFTIDATTSATASAVFAIGNDDEGLLKWSGKIATKSYSPSKQSVGVKRPFIGKVVSPKSKISATPYASKASEYVTADYEAEDYPQNIKYYKEYWASIGDSDKSLPNSQAQWFYVDPEVYPDGFNLTNVGITSYYGQNPVLQIYDGSKAISAASLLTEVTPSYFYSDYQIPLKEQICFAPGQSFWVVAHFPAESNQENYPLGLANADATYGSYSYMSNDMGATWILLSEALKGSPYESMGNEVSWAITAISKNPAWDKVFTLNPSEGQVKCGETQEVTMSNDGQKLVNGTYKFNVSFSTNESNANTLVVPVNVTVKGNAPEMSPVKVVNFGSLLVGESKSIEVELFNEGYGVFTGQYGYLQAYNGGYTSSSEHYTIENVPTEGFPARSTAKIILTYTPQSAGSHTGTITFKNVNGLEFKITTQGVATEPAKIVIEPQVTELGDLDVAAEAATKEFTIKNDGKYPLEYVFPKFSDRQLEFSTGKASHKYGYTALTNLNGATDFAYDGNPALIGETDITSSFSDDVKVSKAIALGFDFPFYGKTYDNVYINSLGAIAFSVGEYSYFPPLSESSESIKGVGYISAYGHQLQFGPNSKVTYAKQDGKFVVKYENVLAVKYDVETTPISFRIMLSANGDVEIFYDDYVSTEIGYDDWGYETEVSRLFQNGSTLFCAIKDPEGNDPLVVTSADVADYWETSDDPAGDVYKQFTTKSSVKFKAPAPYFITAITPAYGVINPGESATLTATVKADDTMYAGATYNNLVVLSNDPENSSSFVKFTANIVGENLLPNAVLTSDNVDFGQVFRTSVAQQSVTVKNAGKSALEVSSVVIASGVFKTDVETPFTIEPGMAKDIIVTLPTVTEGSVADNMTITTTTGELNVSLVGEVIGCPATTLSLSEITETVESGAELTKELTVSNSGDENLVFSVLSGSFTKVTDNNPGDAKVSYTYTSSVDDENVKFEWVDIETTGLGEQYNFSFYNQHDFITVELPFEFPFYGKKYNKMYVYNTGFVSFTEREDQKMWPEPPATFPGGTIYTNVIAPYWGLHTMDSSKTAGTYHYVTEDYAVVSWMEYGNAMNIGVCYQLIMTKDGSFKFQYKSYGDYAIIFDTFGLAGVSNESGSEGFMIPDRLIQFNNAVQFTPIVETTLAPNESKTVQVKVDTDKMAGDYTDVITVNTNVPASEKIVVPVNLTVTGTANAVYPTETVVEEHVAGYVDNNSPFAVANGIGAYDLIIDIKNTGKAAFMVTSMAVECGTYVDPYFGYEMPLFQYLGYYGKHIDMWMGIEFEGWGVYQGEPITVDSKGLQIAIPVSFDIAYAIGEYEGKLMLAVEGLENVPYIEIPFKVVVTDAPYAYINKEMQPVAEIRVSNATSEHKSVESVTLSNMGAYKLTYELRLDPSGVGEEVPDLGGGGIAPMSKNSVTIPELSAEAQEELLANAKNEIVPLENSESVNVFDVPKDFEYNNALYYPTVEGSQALSYGAGDTYSQYKAATYYTAPAEGFNISHIYMATTLTNLNNFGKVESVLKNVDIKVEIIAGDDYENGAVIGKGSLHIDEMEGGQFVIVPLDKSVYLTGGQDFYVRVTYPIGVKYPAYLSSKEESVVSNRFMGYVEGYGWFDMASMFKDTYGSLGYIMTCLETVQGEPWVKMLNETTEGEIAVESSIDINVQINAASAPLVKGNKAMLVIKSNDPQQPIINFPIYLDLNGAPTISVENSTVYAKEAETTTVNMVVVDDEGDDITLTFSDPAQLSTVKSVTSSSETAEITTAEDGTITVKNAPAGVNVEVVIAPNYGDAGKYAFTLVATDSCNNESQLVVNYDVEHVNRAPEAIEVNDIQVVLDAVTPVISFESMFNEPDNEDMTYTMTVSKEGVVTAFTTETSVIFIGSAVGETMVTVVATDVNGASTSNSFKVVVTEPSGIDENSLNANVEVYPNPVAETLYVTCDFSAKNVSYEIFATNGALVYSSKDETVQEDAKAINVAGLAEGVYILQVTAENGGKATFHVIKK